MDIRKDENASYNPPVVAMHEMPIATNPFDPHPYLTAELNKRGAMLNKKALSTSPSDTLR